MSDGLLTKHMEDLRRLKTMADYQFGEGAGAALFHGEIRTRSSSSGRVTQVFDGDERLVSAGVDGRFTLSMEAGRRLHEEFEEPRHRVELGEESLPYVREGRNGFAKFVRSVDDVVRSRDEVLVTGPEDELVATGRAELSAAEMEDFDQGVAVFVR